MTPIRIPYIEKALGISIRTLEGFENGRRKCSCVNPAELNALLT
jgi:hypothetical protein